MAESPLLMAVKMAESPLLAAEKMLPQQVPDKKKLRLTV